jgi:GNAT superfamily N-acetyltransferase
MHSVSLVSATVEDVPTILELIQGLADYERLRDACVATEADLRASLFGDDPAAKVVLARDGDGATLGFALYCWNFSTFLARRGLWLEDLYVRPEARGRGIGRMLLRHLAGIAVQSGYPRLEWNVLDWNEDAIGFYRAVGARLMTEWTTCRLVGPALTALAAEAA